jgi:MFS family permease
VTNAHRSRPVFALLTANTLAFTAEAVSMVVIPWFVLELTGSYARMGIVGFFTVLPRVIAIFLGGQVVDRIGFRTASIASDLLSGISVCGIPLLYATGHLTFEWLIVLVVIGAVFDGPGATAREAMVPELVTNAGMNIDRVNAWFQGARRLSLFIGPVIAGFLVAGVGANNVLWLNAVVFGLSALVTQLFIPEVARVVDPDEETGSFWANTLFGFRFLRRQPLLIWLASIVCLMNFLDAPFTTVQLPALVRENYGSAGRLGLLIGAHGIGAVLGILLFSVLAPRMKRRPTFIIAFGLAGSMFFVLAAAPPFVFAIAAMVMMGIASGPLNPILMSIRQERVPLPYRARVFSTFTAIAFIAIPLGQLIGGFTVEWFGVQAVTATIAGIYVLAVASFTLSPVMHEMNTSNPAQQP